MKRTTLRLMAFEHVDVGTSKGSQPGHAKRRGVSLRRLAASVGHEVKELERIAAKGENEATPAILVSTVLLFLVPIVAFVIAADLIAAHFAVH